MKKGKTALQTDDLLEKNERPMQPETGSSNGRAGALTVLNLSIKAVKVLRLALEAPEEGRRVPLNQDHGEFSEAAVERMRRLTKKEIQLKRGCGLIVAEEIFGELQRHGIEIQ